MTTRSWNGGTAGLSMANAWTPTGAPMNGDTLYIGSGTAEASWRILSGLTIYLQEAANFNSTPPQPPATPPTLSLDYTIIGATTKVSLGGTYDPTYGTGNAIATIDARGFNLNLGTITDTSFIGQGPNGPSSTLTIDVGNGMFANFGTMSVTAGFVSPSSLIVHAASGGASLVNMGLIESDGIVKLDIVVIGRGEIAFGKTFLQSTAGPPDGATVEATRAVDAGQTVNFAGDGTDSHGTLILDDPRQFQGLITNFVASTGNVGALHTDEIVLKGLDVSGFFYHGGSQGGVLTLENNCGTATNLRFAGNYSTDAFQVGHPSSTTSIIELKPTV